MSLNSMNFVPISFPRQARLIYRYVLLLALVFVGMFFSKHHMILLLLTLFPVFYLFARHPKFKRINTSDVIGQIADSLPEPTSEPANCMTQLLALVWPHMFNEERVKSFKENLQDVLDHTPVPYFRSIQLKNLTIGDLAPQITQISTPKKPKAPEHSVLLEMQAIYFPSFNLTGLLTPAGNMPAFNISFTNLTVIFDIYILFEFKPDPFIEYFIPYWTSADVMLVNPPQVSGFDIKLFQSSNLINKDSIKAHMSATFSNMIYSWYGLTDAFVWDRITGIWKSDKLIGSHGMQRVSLSHGEMLRMEKIMIQALDYCHKIHIPEPLTIQTKAYKDIETTTYYLEMIQEFMNNKTIDRLSRLAEEFTADAPSRDELAFIFEPTHRFIIDWFKTWSSTIPVPERGKKKKTTTITGNVDKLLAPLYSYVNFLALQSKVNPEMNEKLQLENRVNALQNMILSFHNKFFKMSS